MAPPTAPPSLRVDVGAIVTPGDRLGPASRGKVALLPGSGTYIRHGTVFASLVGTLCATRHDDADDGSDGAGERWTISVDSEGVSPEGGAGEARKTAFAKHPSAVCPQVRALILGRVNRVARPTHATVDIVAIVPENTDALKGPSIIPFPEPFTGTLRQNELRPNSSLEIKIEECVRPGDVVLARIHANGERDFILTTAEAELGVVQAICESSGCEMQPVSWKEMRCKATGVKEARKVAKPRRAG
ncbi:hypothetical protein ACHAXT_012734 [Thalassiosira profunda]